MSKKLLCALLSATLTATLFSACGGEVSSSSSMEEKTSISETEVSVSEKETEVSEEVKVEEVVEPEVQKEYRIKLSKSFEGDENNVYSTDEYVYDENGVLLREGTLVYEYDDKGNVIKKTRYMDPELTQIYYYNEYTYDDNGNMLSDIPYNINFIDYKPVKSEYETFEYDENNRLSMRYRYWGELVVAADTITFSYSYTYDEDGKLIRMNTYYEGDPSFDSGYTLYIYDENGLLTKEEEHNSAGNLLTEYNYSYDERGNLLLKEGYYCEFGDAELFEKYAYAYDDNNNMIMESIIEMYPESEYAYGTLYEWEIVE